MKAIRRWLMPLGIAGIAAAAAAAQAQTTVTMWTFLDPNKTSPREVALKAIIAEFEARNPDLRIKVEPQDFAQMPTKFFLGHRTGTNPDVVWIDAKNLGGLAQSGAGADLGALVTAKWPPGAADDFFVKAGWEAGMAEGRLVGLPLFHGASVIYYRKDLLAAAGIDPSTLTTWDALRDAALRLTRDSDGDGRIDVWGLGMPLAPIKTESTPVLIGMLDAGPAFEGCKAVYATDTGVRALSFTVGLIRDAKVTPREALVANVDDVTDQLIAGRHAMAISSNLRFSVIARSATFGGRNVGILPWPSWDGSRPGPMPVSGWWVAAWKDSRNPAAAGRFIDHLVAEDSVRRWMTVGGQVPTRRSLLADPFLAEPENAWVRTMIDAWSARSWMEPTACNTRTLQAGLNEAVARVLLDGIEPLAALREAERKFADSQ